MNIKILSINQKEALSDLDIAVKKDILILCNMFTISVPKENRTLDIISETVFRFCRYNRDYKRIAEKCCIDEELVKFIQNKLKNNGYLDDKYNLSDNGKKLLNELESSIKKDVEYEIATVLVDLVSGKLLKIVLRDADIQKYNCQQKGTEDNKNIEFYAGTIGRSASIKAILFNDLEKYKTIIPKPKQISKIGIKGQISIQEENPELVYLHCICAYQKGNYDDFLVTDGIGKKFSIDLSNALQNDKKNSLNVKMLDEIVQENVSETSKIAHKKVIWKYRQITKKLEDCNKFMNSEDSDEPQSKNKEKYRENQLKKVVIALHQAFENTLFQIVETQENSTQNAIKTLSICKNHNEIQKMILSICEKLKFRISENEKAKFKMGKGKFKNQIPREMYPLLALCIVGSNEDHNHVFLKIANHYKNLFNEIYDLNFNRDTVAHGGDLQKDKGKKWLKKKYDYFCKVIGTIYPEALIFEKDYQPAKEIDNIYAKAKSEMYKTFGVANFHNFPKSLQNTLEKTFILKQELNNDNFTQYVIDVSSCLQTAIYFTYSNNYGSVPLSRTKNECLQRIKQFISTEIPDNIEKVNENRFKRAILGENVTLGANLLAMFGILEDEDLDKMKEKTPTLVEIISKIVELRGHGNYTVEFSEENKKITEQSLSIIKIILEN